MNSVSKIEFEEIMKMNKRIKFLNAILAALILSVTIYSCSSEHAEGDINEEGKKIRLSISLNENSGENNLRLTGDPNSAEEAKIHRLDVLVFKVDGGERNGYKAQETANEVEVKDIEITAGDRHVYVVANAPVGYFDNVMTLNAFKSAMEDLSTQGQFPASGGSAEGDLPIGGEKPFEGKTNLTMCGYKEITCSKTAERQYLGYTTPTGIPPGGSGYAPLGSESFLVERLVARVAFKKITFQLPSELTFEAGYPKTDEYEYALDSIFLMNVKTKSYFASGNTPLAGYWGHGNKDGYLFLQSKLSDVSLGSVLTSNLEEPINSPSYDIGTASKHSPLWFYVFENEDSLSPTYFVISVRYDFISKTPTDFGKAKTVKYYYPVVVNGNGIANGKPHNYIKRNHQYGISAIIKSLGSLSDENTIEELSFRSAAIQNGASSSVIEVQETVGENLFPWTGNVYK